jgi:7-keto-8-aminopelargonate synthetase-like enzyme
LPLGNWYCHHREAAAQLPAALKGVRQFRSEKQLWRHNDLAHLEQFLCAVDRDLPKLILNSGLHHRARRLSDF